MANRLEIKSIDTDYDKDDYGDKIANVVIRCRVYPESKNHMSVGMLLDRIAVAIIMAGQGER